MCFFWSSSVALIIFFNARSSFVSKAISFESKISDQGDGNNLGLIVLRFCSLAMVSSIEIPDGKLVLSIVGGNLLTSVFLLA